MRATVEQVRCDLCNYGGPYSRPEEFRQFGDVDLCRWCSDDRPLTQMECGGHLVTFVEGSWSCSCGEVYRTPGFFVSLRVRLAVPSMLNATANMHIEGRA